MKRPAAVIVGAVLGAAMLITAPLAIGVWLPDIFTNAPVVRWAMNAEKHVLSRGVLEYRVRETKQDPACAVWLLAV